MNVRYTCSAVALGVTVMLLSWSGPGVASSAEVEWDDVKSYSGTVTFDRYGDTLIVGGTIAMYVNGVAVHTLVCDTRGAYGDYWPKQAPAGSRSYSTGPIDVSGKKIQGPTLSIKLVAKPYTAIDVNAIEIATGE